MRWCGGQARRLVEQHRLRELAIQDRRVRNDADKRIAAQHSLHQGAKDGGCASKIVDSRALGMSAALAAPPPPPPLGGCGGLGLPPPPPHGTLLPHATAADMAKMTVPSAAQMQESLKFMAAAAAQSGGLVADPFTLALMASASGAADPFMNLPGQLCGVSVCATITYDIQVFVLFRALFFADFSCSLLS